MSLSADAQSVKARAVGVSAGHQAIKSEPGADCVLDSC